MSIIIAHGKEDPAVPYANIQRPHCVGYAHNRCQNACCSVKMPRKGAMKRWLHVLEALSSRLMSCTGNIIQLCDLAERRYFEVR